LVWSTASGESDWGIVGWRNVIQGYNLSGATTELNAECYAALRTMERMARELGKHDESAGFAQHADQLQTAINSLLLDRQSDLYYINIDQQGQAHSDVTSDLVFPVMFDVAPPHVAAQIIAKLSSADFWTPAGMRTTPRDSPTYDPVKGWGLLGGVWVGVSFWYAFAAASFSPEFMAYALSTTFHNYSADPRRTNTVPGQFSEWLNGETLVNQGMMLSPWFPPRYLWAAIEGMAGLDLRVDGPALSPHLAPQWKWLAVRNLPFRERSLTWIVVRTPALHVYTTFSIPDESIGHTLYDTDISGSLRTSGDSISTLGLQQGTNILLFAGNSVDRTVTSYLAADVDLAGSYRLRTFNSLLGHWDVEEKRLTAEEVRTGIVIELERNGFCLFDLRQET